MDESSGNYADDEYFDNHDYDDTDDDTDDDNDHKKDSNTAAGAAPTQSRPGHARPRWAKPGPKNIICLACFGMNGSQIGPVKLSIGPIAFIFHALSDVQGFRRLKRSRIG